MSSRMYSKPSRAWERGGPPGGRRRFGGRGSPLLREPFRRRDMSSPERSKRGKWESSPSRNHIGSPNYTHRRGFESPPRPGRRGDMGSPKTRRSFDAEQHHRHQRFEDEYQFHEAARQGFIREESSGPAGLVFLCNSATMRDCFHFRVLGLPVAQIEIVERVIPRTKLFLFNVETKELYGVFEAASRGGLDLVPEAFQDSKGAYAAQVRFSLVQDCLPLADEKTRDVLRDNFSQKGKFDCELSPNQVAKIIQLFSYTEIRPQHGPDWGDMAIQESRNVAHGSNAFSSDALRLPHTPYLHENNMFPDTQVLINSLNKSLADAVQADPASVLAQGVIDEVDQLAFKYLKNDPGYNGVRLEPVNTYLLSTSLKNHALNHGQPYMQPHGLQIGSFPGGMNRPGSNLPDSAKKVNPEQSVNDRGKRPGDNISSSNHTERGLLPVPIVHHQIPLNGMPPQHLGMPPQQGVLYGVRPELGGSHILPFHPLQGSHMFRPQMLNQPPLLNIGKAMPKNTQLGDRSSNRYHGMKAFKKSKKNKQRKLLEKGVGSSKDSKDGPDTGEPTAAKTSGP